MPFASSTAVSVGTATPVRRRGLRWRVVSGLVLAAVTLGCAWIGGGAFNVFLLRQFLMQLPRDLDEAATIDGAGPFRILWSILLPLCRPALTTLTIFSAIEHWNDFLGPLVYLNSPEKFTVALGLNAFQAVSDMKYPQEYLLMAASVMTIVPAIVVFFSSQRYFMEGIVLSGVKN